MRQEPHPLSGFIYQSIGDGQIRVENPNNGQYGIFRSDGTWLEGQITHADLHFLGFIGGPDLRPEEDVIWTRLPLPLATDVPEDAYMMGRLPDGMARTVGKYDPAPAKQTEQGPRSPGQIELSFFLDNERKPDLLPNAYRMESPMPGGPQKVSTRRYFSPEYEKMEVEKIWRRVWQMACREDDIPNVGDYHVYEIAGLSWLIVRTGEHEIKAHQNVCLHRGRILRECDGKNAKVFRCPYHGWSWNLDGTVKEITCEWDFPGVRDDVNTLPGAQVGRWAGWVFINPDPDCMPLEEFLGPVMMESYEKFSMQHWWKQAHVTRPMPANWKIAMEAFMEGWHVVATHPQLLLAGYDNGSDRYDVFGHWGRAAVLGSGPSGIHRSIFYSKEEALALHRANADGTREYLRPIIGETVETYSDAELNDVCYNDLFPNFHPWGGFARINFRFRPIGDDPENCLMDVILLAPWPKDKPRPPAAEHHMLTAEQSWCDAPELGTLARIIDQDVANMRSMQQGLKAKRPGYIWYSDYQEGKIRNFHRNYDRWMDLDEDQGG